MTNAEINALVQACRPGPNDAGTLGTIVPMGFESVQNLVTRYVREAERLREALERIANANDGCESCAWCNLLDDHIAAICPVAIAAAALKEQR